MRPFMSDEAKKKLDEMGRGGETRGDGMRKEKKLEKKTFGHLNLKNTVQISL